MAFKNFYPQTDNTSTSLGSIHSALDGVPFKIGSSFQPPSNISLPPAFYNIQAPATLTEDYSFDTEVGVLNWARAREEAAEAEQRAQENAIASTIEGFVQPATSTNSSASSGIKHNSQFSSQTCLPGTENNSNTTDCATVSNNLFVNVSSSILTPTPIPSSEVADNQNITNSQAVGKTIDVSLFEKEDDPFDNLELQTLNDLEELKNVLGSNVLGSSSHSPAEQRESVSTDNINNSNNVYENVTVCNDVVRLSQNDSSRQSELSECVKNGNVYENVSVGQNGVVAIDSLPDLDDGEYEELANVVHLSSQTAAYTNTSPSITAHALPPLDGKVHHDIHGNVLSKSTLPPIGKVGSEGIEIMNRTDIKSFRPNAYENVHVNNTEDSSASCDLNNSFGSRQISRYSPTMFSIPDFNPSPLRSSKSSPDITKLSDIDNLLPDVFRNSAPRKPSSDQQWNKFSPLPDMHPSRPFSKTPPPVSLYRDRSDSPIERDPYSKLSSEQKKCVTSLLSMGFKKAKLSRAVEKLGPDAKEVINYLCNVAKLVDNGCDEDLAETALLLCDKNIDKAQNYIDLYTQFQELGFANDKIKDALINNEMDRDKVLDVLTA